jgi:hypothetical protein
VVSVAWDQVQNVAADKLVTVELKDGQTLLGTLAATQERTEITTDGQRREVSSAEVVALRDATEQRTWERLRRPGWFDLWTGGATLGFAGAQGNAETRTLAVGFNATRITRGDKTNIYFNAIKASAMLQRQLESGQTIGVSDTTAQAVRGGWGYSRNLGPRLFLNVFNDYEYDLFQNLDLRIVFGGGLGYSVWKSERGRLDLLGGAAYNREKFQGEPSTRQSAEAYFGNEFDYKLNSRMSLFQKWRVFPNLSDAGEYRSNFDLRLTSQLTRWLNWNTAISDRLLSNPVPGRKKNDLIYAIGLGVNFAR